MTPSITFPCGCELNEHSVLGMCVKHVVELREARVRQEKEARMHQERFLKDVMSVMGAG